MSNVKIIKILLLITIIIPVIAIFLFYIWFLYEASKLDKYEFTEDMKKELMIVANINESKSFNPILIQFNDVLGPNYYSNYELKFEISKEDFEKNNLLYNENQVYSTLTDSSMHEEKDRNTYTCYIKCTKPVNETKYIIMENVYRKQRHIPLETYTAEQIIENTNIATNLSADNNVNAPEISQEWWKEYDLAIDNLDTNSCNSNLSLGSIAENGSSNSNISASRAKALAIATLCCIPPDNSYGYLSNELSKPTLSI